MTVWINFLSKHNYYDVRNENVGPDTTKFNYEPQYNICHVSPFSKWTVYEIFSMNQSVTKL